MVLTGVFYAGSQKYCMETYRREVFHSDIREDGDKNDQMKRRVGDILFRLAPL